MDSKRVTRKLRAILSADVHGYSRLMGDDEVATFKTITEYREVFSSIVKDYNGRVVDSPGDNILSEFASVVDAVQCAVEIQKVLKAKNEELPENRKMVFRIGVNLGDVIHEGDRLYGDGVNIAARIESLAEPGGICISGTAYEHIENKLALGYEFFGEHSVKNIKKPVKVYRVPMEPGQRKLRKKGLNKLHLGALAALLVLLVAGAGLWIFYSDLSTAPVEDKKIETVSESTENQEPPLAEEPSIAVLPFDNMSGDPKEDYFCDGITEQIISSLAKIPKLLVIARNSAFTYKGKPVKVQKVAEDLGVRYVLEGSVRKSGDRVRITAQLIDAKTGSHIWSDSFDRKLKEIFALQDEITQRIIEALSVELTEGEVGRIYSRGTNNLEAYLKVLKGLDLVLRFRSKGDNALGRQMYEDAIKLDPNYDTAYTALGWTHRHDAKLNWTDNTKKSMKMALEYAQKALSINDSNPNTYALLVTIYLGMGMFDKALAAGEKALELEPNGAHVNAIYGYTLIRLGRYEEGLSYIKKAIKLNPITPGYYYLFLGSAYFCLGQNGKAISAYEEGLKITPNYLVLLNNLAWSFIYGEEYNKAVTTLNKIVKLNRKFIPAYTGLAACYGLMGKGVEADKAGMKVLKLNPKFSLDKWEKRHMKCWEVDRRNKVLTALSNAGLK